MCVRVYVLCVRFCFALCVRVFSCDVRTGFFLCCACADLLVMCERDFSRTLCDFVYYATRARFVMCVRVCALCCVCVILLCGLRSRFCSEFCVRLS